uniref:Transmembrane protein 59 n=1 Tax=Monopterus albus TaxID=43700 RepID=A0A3Q3JWR6_MONAL
MGTLSSFVCVLGLFVLLACASASSDVFNSVLGNTASCHKSCEMTYSLHTYPREGELYACQRGCRLFSICQFVRDSEDLNQTRSECESTCDEAYPESEEQYACNLGCQNQLPFAEQRHEQLESMMPRIHLLYPLTLVRGFWDDMMSQAHSFITSTWTFYLQADDGKVVIFQVVIKEKMDDLLSYCAFKQQLVLFLCKCNGEHYYFCLVFCRLDHKSGWILTTTLILSVLVLIWICCATVETAVDQYVPTEKLSIYGDMDYIKEQKLTPYPASSLLIITSKGSEEEAGPLPTKVNLGQSDI